MRQICIRDLAEITGALSISLLRVHSMKTIGLLGGMSWESTVSYYQLINIKIKQQLGGLHSAKIILHSVDFAEIEALQHSGDWEQTGYILAEAAKSLEAAGANFLVICTNTMHKVAPYISSQINIPLLHIADCTGVALTNNKHKKIGLLGTRFTMEQAFYKDRISDRYDIQVLTPTQSERDEVHRIIYEELCLGQITQRSRAYYLSVINSLHEQGAEAIILGCTEIALLIQQEHTIVPLYDTTKIHALTAVDHSLS